MNPNICAPTITKTWEYLYTVNRNNYLKLDIEDLKDVHQECTIRLSTRSYNDQLVKQTILTLYRRAVEKRARCERFSNEQDIVSDDEANEVHELENSRRQRVGLLKLTKLQKKIVELLVAGHSYKEVRQKLRISTSKLAYNVNRIRTANAAISGMGDR